MQILLIEHGEAEANTTDLIMSLGHSWTRTNLTLLNSLLVERIDAAIIAADLPDLGMLSVLQQIAVLRRKEGKEIPTLVHGVQTQYIHGVINFNLREIGKIFYFAEFHQKSGSDLSYITDFIERQQSKVPRS